MLDIVVQCSVVMMNTKNVLLLAYEVANCCQVQTPPYTVIVPMECHFMLRVPDKYIAGFTTMHKMPPMLYLELVKLHNEVRNMSKKGKTSVMYL